ncbi:MAG: hypothetical protein JO000_06030 [Alphaproteobacteria bacterium]|nr:hypothetical protein [Alphaproteobacteria bacterium]
MNDLRSIAFAGVVAIALGAMIDASPSYAQDAAAPAGPSGGGAAPIDMSVPPSGAPRGKAADKGRDARSPDAHRGQGDANKTGEGAAARNAIGLAVPAAGPTGAASLSPPSSPGAPVPSSGASGTGGLTSPSNQNRQPVAAAPNSAPSSHGAINGTGMAHPGGAGKIGGAAKGTGTISGGSFRTKP